MLHPPCPSVEDLNVHVYLIFHIQEIEVLRAELETCQRVSESRCKAMRLFKGHVRIQPEYNNSTLTTFNFTHTADISLTSCSNCTVHWFVVFVIAYQ